MADHGEVEYATADGNDYVEHEGTYSSFIKAAVVGTLFCVNILIFLAIGGVAGHWLLGTGVFFLALLAAIYGLASASHTPGLVVMVLGLLALLITSHG